MVGDNSVSKLIQIARIIHFLAALGLAIIPAILLAGDQRLPQGHRGCPTTACHRAISNMVAYFVKSAKRFKSGLPRINSFNQLKIKLIWDRKYISKISSPLPYSVG